MLSALKYYLAIMKDNNSAQLEVVAIQSRSSRFLVRPSRYALFSCRSVPTRSSVIRSIVMAPEKADELVSTFSRSDMRIERYD